MNHLDYVFEYGRLKKENERLIKAISLIIGCAGVLFILSISTLLTLAGVLI